MLVPAKSGAVAGAISSLDAAWVLQAAVGMRSLDATQALACDATGNGHLTSLDAARILEFAVGRRSRLPVAEICASDWLFVPAIDGSQEEQPIPPLPGTVTCRPGAIAYGATADVMDEQNFRGLAFGDCTGNWSPAGGAGAARRSADRGAVRLGRIRALSDGRADLGVSVRGRAPFVSLAVELAYDPRAVHPTAVRAAAAARGAAISFNDDGHGTLRIALASANPLRPKGSHIVVTFDSLAPRISSRSVRLVRATVDE